MKFCMQCMSQYEDGFHVCPHCGFQEGTLPTHSRCITPGEVLADRYIVGMPLSVSGWMIRYIGYDALTEKKVVIHEFFPTRYAVRNVGEQALTVVKPQPFYQYQNALLRNARLLAESGLSENISAVYESFERGGTAYVIAAYHDAQPLREYLTVHAPLQEPQAEAMLLPLLRALDKLHDGGFAVGGFSPDSFVVENGKLVLYNYLENLFFHITDNPSDLKPSEGDRYFPPERLDASQTVSCTPAQDVYSAGLLLYALLGVQPPDGYARRERSLKKQRDLLPKPTSGGARMSKSKENAMMNAAAVSLAYRTPDMETFIRELSGDKEVVVNTQKGKGFPLWAKIAIPSAAVVLIAAAVLVIPMLLGKTDDLPVEGQTVVPSVVHDSLDEAAAALKKAGLLLEISGKTVDDSQEENRVLSQSVEQGAIVGVNSAVGVTVSAKSGAFSMPNFTGIRLDVCTAMLDDIGMKYTVETAPSDHVAQDCVTAQSIAPYARTTAAQTVMLTVSEGAASPQEEYEVDNYVDRPYDEVISHADAPFEVLDRVVDPDKPEGTVVEQYPSAGESADEPVKVVVTTANATVIVPDVTLLDKNRAESLLSYYGLTAEFTVEVSDEVAAGLVVSQEPAPGEEAESGTALRLTVSEGKEPVAVPDTVGKPLDAAAKELNKAQIAFTVTYEADNGKPKDEVLRQSVAAGETVRRGEAIVLTVNAADAVAEVPDITGLDLTEADRIVTEAGFHLLIYVDEEHPYTEGNVTAQGPKAGLSAPVGDDIVVLLGGREEVYTGPATLQLSQQSITLQKGQEFTLDIDTRGITDLALVNYEISNPSVADVVHIDKATLAMTFRGLSAGTTEVTISCGELKQICTITVI